MNQILFQLFILIIFSISLIFLQSKYLVLVDTPKEKHKKNYNKNIPLSGGIYFFISIFFYSLSTIYQYENYVINLFLFFFLILGIFSDLKSNFRPKIRILFQTVLIFILIFTLDLKINRTGVFFLDYFIQNNIFNLIFTSFCILVLINGTNFCDGVNCNVVGYYLILSFGIFLSSLNLPSYLRIESIIIIFFVFYIFNFFKKYFLGDSGVYVVSIFMAIYIIKLININTTISPILALNLLWYPAFENLFSILRRSLHNKKIHAADRKHLHILIFELLKKKNTTDFSNSLSGLIINIFMFIGIIYSIKYSFSSKILLTILMLNIIIYLIVYFYLFLKK
jgi:UDP-N-acetylmuramyl pentapeptide phosphotransferase/UDP-N-acetylglucosamine-1-phosphate transferase